MRVIKHFIGEGEARNSDITILRRVFEFENDSHEYLYTLLLKEYFENN